MSVQTQGQTYVTVNQERFVSKISGMNDPWQRNFYVGNSATGTNTDIQGWELWLCVKSDINDTDTNAVFQKKFTIATGTPIYNYLLTLSNSEFSTLGTFVYDIRVKEGAGAQAITRIRGTWTQSLVVNQDLTVTG